jgi:ABC-type nickel/cobalt efflux system permease component RcnA
MKKLHYCIAIIAISLLWMLPADAHPLGNFTINHYAGIHVDQDKIGIDYVLDMAEIPAFQEINRQTDKYPLEKCNEVNSNLELLINKQPLVIQTVESAVEFPPGVGGLSTLRLTCNFQGAVSVAANQLIEFADNFYPQRLGWREITVAGNNVPIQGDFTTKSISNRLTDYPNDLLRSPLDQRHISLKINHNQTLEQPVLPSVQSFSGFSDLAGRSNDVFTSLITKDYNFFTILIALLIAFVWGGLHALSPGHGKTVVGAYLVGSRSKPQHALFLGLTVTITHTASIFILGLVALGTSKFTLTEQLYPWLSIVSGVLVTGIGMNLFISRLQNSHHHHEHSHHVHDHHHHHHEHSHHVHDHHHDSSITWSNLLALGISGGILPCPSALVVLLSAIALGKIGLGLALVCAFSVGLAAVLTGIGLMLVYAKHKFEQMPLQIPKIKMLPVASALCITLIGLGITTQALLVQPW